MGGFLTGTAVAAVLAVATYYGLVAFGVSSTDRTADSSVKIERGVEYNSIMIEPHESH